MAKQHSIITLAGADGPSGGSLANWAWTVARSGVISGLYRTRLVGRWMIKQQWQLMAAAYNLV